VDGTRWAQAVVVAGALLATAVTAPGSSGSTPGRPRGHTGHPRSPHAAVVRGVVVAREAPRRVLVLATPSGLVRTLRVRALRETVGAALVARVLPLADGTYRTLALAAHGRAHRARLRATIVRAWPDRLLVSAGGSDFAIARPRLRALASRLAGTPGQPSTGEVVDIAVSIGAQGAEALHLQQVGQTSVLELDGVLSAVGPQSLVLAVNEGALTTVEIPPSLTLPPTIVVGDQVELLVAYANQSFSLITIKDNGAAAAQAAAGVSQSGDGESEGVEVEGVLTSFSASSVVIQPGDGAAPVTLAVPTNLALPAGLAIGARVAATGQLVGGVLTLERLEVRTGEGEASDATKVEGVVSSVGPTTLVVQPADGGAAVTFAVPAGFDLTGIVQGVTVRAEGRSVNGTLTLQGVEVPEADRVHVSGTVVTVDASTLVVQPGDGGAAVTFAVPAGFDLSGVTAGMAVEARGVLANGSPLLTEVQAGGTDD
jgi:hypothetical protein